MQTGDYWKIFMHRHVSSEISGEKTFLIRNMVGTDLYISTLSPLHSILYTVAILTILLCKWRYWPDFSNFLIL